MICKRCGKSFMTMFSSICPYCGCDNGGSSNKEDDFIDDGTENLFSTPGIGLGFGINGDEHKEEKHEFDPYNLDDPEASSDKEYMDDDDYDDFDHS